jgi:hypothetical protein
MGQMKYILLLTLLALFFPTTVPRESLSNELYPRSANDADMDENTAEGKQIPAPSGPCHLLKGVTYRRVALSALPFVTHQLIQHTNGHVFGRLRSSVAIAYQAAPLYQMLLVYRS